jgi:hypothetical protein
LAGQAEVRAAAEPPEARVAPLVQAVREALEPAGREPVAQLAQAEPLAPAETRAGAG